MFRKFVKPFNKCLGHPNGDELLWHTDLKPHVSGEFSIAVVQANSILEDQSQVLTSPSATYIGVYDGHGGPEASRFVNRNLFPLIDSKFETISFIYSNSSVLLQFTLCDSQIVNQMEQFHDDQAR